VDIVQWKMKGDVPAISGDLCLNCNSGFPTDGDCQDINSDHLKSDSDITPQSYKSTAQPTWLSATHSSLGWTPR
jgi:hypothetical protein